MLQFKITNRKTGDEKSFKTQKDSVIVGRTKECDIVLDSKSVSRKHTEILRIENDFFLVDLESGNGTFLNGKLLKPLEKTPLQNKDSIRIEEFEIIPVLPRTEKVFSEENTDSGIIEIKMIKKVLNAIDTGQNPSLEIIKGPHEGRKAFLDDPIDELFIGRDPACHLSIESDVISRRHAVIRKKWGGVTITDLQSKNGMIIHDKKVKEYTLKDGDIITLGNIQILYRNPQEIDVEGLSKQVEEKLKTAAQEETPSLSPNPESGPEPKSISEPASEQAKASLAKNEPENKSEPAADASKTDTVDQILQDVEASQPLPPKTIKRKSLNLSAFEIFLIGVGILTLVGAILAIYGLLF